MIERRLYDSVAWRKAAKAFLAKNPLCVICLARGRHEPARIVDHIKPHGGDTGLFWDRTNWQALCAPCHSRHKQIQEHRGHRPGCDINGIPLDPNQFWKEKS